MTEDIENQEQDEGATWWCKLLARVVSVVAAIVCGICAIPTLFPTLKWNCILAGVIMLCVAFIILVIEAPICCSFFEGTKKVGDWLGKRKYWQKGLFYLCISSPPVILCPGITTLIGCVLPFAAGVIYGLMSLGKKADRSEMMSNARGNDYKEFSNETDAVP